MPNRALEWRTEAAAAGRSEKARFPNGYDWNDPDGKTTIRRTVAPIHWDDNGTLQDIITDWRQPQAGDPGQAYDWINTDNQWDFVGIREDISAGDTLRFQKDGEWVSLDPQSLFWTNDLDQIQQIAEPSGIQVPVENDLTWPDAYGPGIDFRWIVAVNGWGIAKRLEISQLSDLPEPSVVIQAGGNPKLRLHLGINFSNNIEVWIDGTEFSLGGGNRTRTTSGPVEFRNPQGETLFGFKPPRAWDSGGTSRDNTGTTFTFRKQGNTVSVYVDVPWSWLETATYPVEIDADFNVAVAASGDDGYRYEGGGINTSSTTLFVGPFSGNYEQIWLRFDNVTIANGNTASSATVSLALEGTSTNAVNTTVHVIDENDHPAPTTTAQWSTDHSSHIGSGVAWTTPTASTGTATTTSFHTDATTLFGKAYWASGEAMGVHIDDPTSVGTNDRSFGAQDHATLAAPEIDITHSAALTISPALVTQTASGTSPQLNMEVAPALEQQLASGTAPQVNMGVAPALVQQLLAGTSPTQINFVLFPSLQQQLAAGIDPTVSLGAQMIDPALVTQTATAFAPQLNLILLPSLEQQLAQAFDPNVAIEQFVDPALTQQLVAGTAPQINLVLLPALEQQLLAGTAPTQLNMTIDAAREQQLVTAFDPDSVSAGQTIDPALEQQLAQAFDPNVGAQTISPALVGAGDSYLTLDGTGDWAEKSVTPSTYPTSSTGIRIEARIRMDDWTPAALTNIMSLEGNSVGDFEFRVDTDGTLQLYDNGGSTGSSSTATGFSDGTDGYVAVVDDGSTNLTFYTSSDGTTWDQLGTTQSSVMAANSETGATFHVGQSPFDSRRFSGRIYWIKVWADSNAPGSGGTVDTEYAVDGSFTLFGDAAETTSAGLGLEAIDPQINLILLPAQQDQTMVAYDPTVSLAGAATQTIDPALEQQLLAGIDPQLNLILLPSLEQQLLAAVDPNVAIQQFIDPALVSQLLTAYDPQINLILLPAQVDQTMQAFVPAQLNFTIDPGLTQQLTQAFDPNVAIEQFIDPALVQQLTQAFDPSSIGATAQTISPALATQLIQAFTPLINYVSAQTITGVGSVGEFIRWDDGGGIYRLYLVPRDRRWRVHTRGTDYDVVSDKFKYNTGDEDFIMGNMTNVWPSQQADATATLKAAINARLQQIGYRKPNGGDLA